MTKRLLTVLLLALVAFGIASCASPADLNYIPEGGSYSEADLPEALADSDAGRAARVSMQDAPQVRQEALAALRQEGDDASRLADALTAEFPVDVPAVPYQVELGTFEGERAWLVYEAWGEGDGELSFRRLWVFSFDETTVMAAQSSR